MALPKNWSGLFSEVGVCISDISCAGNETQALLIAVDNSGISRKVLLHTKFLKSTKYDYLSANYWLLCTYIFVLQRKCD